MSPPLPPSVAPLLSEGQRSESARVSEVRYRRLFEAAQDGILLLNAETGQIDDVNPYLVRMLGYSHEEFLGKRLWEIGAFFDIEQSKALFTELQSQGFVRYENLPLVSNAGAKVEVEFVSNVYDCDGVKVIQCNIRNISDRVELQRQAVSREHRYKAISATALDAFVTSDSTGRIVGWNPSAERIFGYTDTEAIGQTLTLLMPQRFQDRHLDSMQRMRSGIESHMIGKTVELVGLRKNAVEFPLELSMATWIDGDKQYFTGIIRDITHRKAADSLIHHKGLKLKESNAELERFAYVASHDLREPLRMVNSFLTLLERRNPQLDAESKEFLGYAKEGAVRMDHMVLALLEFSRVGRSGATFASVDTSLAVTEAVANLGLLIKDTKSDVTVVAPLPVVMGNRDEMMRLFQNLIGNALKYHHPDRSPIIHISCRKSDHDWLFLVQDNGIGLEREYFDRIFVIFQRLHGRREYEGTGIGLAICKKIVTTHGGKIWVESEPGKGSTFFFTIPMSGSSPANEASDG